MRLIFDSIRVAPFCKAMYCECWWCSLRLCTLSDGNVESPLRKGTDLQRLSSTFPSFHGEGKKKKKFSENRKVSPCSRDVPPRFLAARCVFIHDPRLRGSTDAILYQRRKGSEGGTSMGSPLGRDIFYWPDMPRRDNHGNTVSRFHAMPCPRSFSLEAEIDDEVMNQACHTLF